MSILYLTPVVAMNSILTCSIFDEKRRGECDTVLRLLPISSMRTNFSACHVPVLPSLQL